MIVEYGSQERGVLMTPTDGQEVSYCPVESCIALRGRENNDFSVETLLSYEPTPGTVFFVDYDRAKDRRPKGKPSGGPSSSRPGRGPSRPSGGPGGARPPFRRGASGSSDRGRNRPRRTGRS
jgi:hypothetical protein